jgi:hypothetical protein
MAVAPYFVADLDTLKSSLRLTNLDGTEDSSAILDRAIEWARGYILRKLGVSVAAQWKAVAYSENPTTEEGALRMIANLLETRLVLLDLIDRLPHFFMDDSGGTMESYNEDATFRKKNSEERKELRKRIQAEVEDFLALLSGSQELGSSSRIKIYDGANENANSLKPALGGSTFYLPLPFDGNFRSSGLFPGHE